MNFYRVNDGNSVVYRRTQAQVREDIRECHATFRGGIVIEQVEIPSDQCAIEILLNTGPAGLGELKVLARWRGKARGGMHSIEI